MSTVNTIVVGGTKGIGKVISNILKKRGDNLITISRNSKHQNNINIDLLKGRSHINKMLDDFFAARFMPLQIPEFSFVKVKSILLFFKYSNVPSEPIFTCGIISCLYLEFLVMLSMHNFKYFKLFRVGIIIENILLRLFPNNKIFRFYIKCLTYYQI